MTYLNQENYKSSLTRLNKAPDGFLDINEYWTFLKNGYTMFNSICENNFKDRNHSKYENQVVLDCANGVIGCYKDEILKLFNNNEKIDVIII